MLNLEPCTNRVHCFVIERVVVANQWLVLLVTVMLLQLLLSIYDVLCALSIYTKTCGLSDL